MAEALSYQQEHIASQCEIIVRGLARVGIIEEALARVLEAFIAKELQPWIKTFPKRCSEHPNAPAPMRGPTSGRMAAAVLAVLDVGGTGPRETVRAIVAEARRKQ